MKATTTIFLCFLMLAGKLTLGQNTHFATDGVVEYDKTINMYALIKKNIDKDNESWYAPLFEQYKKTQPQFKTYKSTLTFSKDKTLFTPIEPDPAPNSFYSNDPMAVQNNTIFTDLASQSVIMQKKVFDELFLVRDTTRKIKWKITTETRDVAGYKCRRANAIVMDSIYVVAFYTDEIAVTGGPESFSGLPGMILGVALPHENVTWFASKVTESVVTAKALAPPTKGKATNNKGLMDILKGATKDWGDYAKSYLKAFSL
ncbi:GLPGLI family protein [Mucilaginibacter gracilis]|uniref:GLPGLI family protein n=2 Tax=Mucilaginibacter gracilis TaxID=423350 RepID=A0A495J2G9_9SPHI|nr:GLPGLI family protein [Mucilaginibacter gracilis]